METKELHEISTLCSCLDDCYGECWEWANDDFSFVINDWFVPGTFRIEGFPVWYGTVGGYFDAEFIEDFRDAITPDRTDWTLRYTIEDDKFIGILSHHDGTGTITVSKHEEQDDE